MRVRSRLRRMGIAFTRLYLEEEARSRAVKKDDTDDARASMADHDIVEVALCGWDVVMESLESSFVVLGAMGRAAMRDEDIVFIIIVVGGVAEVEASSSSYHCHHCSRSRRGSFRCWSEIVRSEIFDSVARKI